MCCRVNRFQLAFWMWICDDSGVTLERRESQSHSSSKITAQPVQEMIFAAGSPQDACRVFESHSAVKSEDEGVRVKDEWNELRQKEGENIMPFYGRAKAIRMKLESYGDKRLDASMCKHIARRMLPSLKLCSDHVLLLPDLSSRTMDCLLYTSPSPRDLSTSRMPSSA